MASSFAPDPSHMHTALILARRGLGSCAPNPSVGCVIVKNGRVVGRGHTAPGGRPHAETVALAMAGEDARGATAYVTLEPCSHHGQTPPCAEALIRAGIARAVVACVDSNPKVNGAGIRMLRDAGIEVVTDMLAREARELNKGFFRRLFGAPEVNIKIATTQDGSFTHPSSRWITGESSRRYVHLMRAQHDGILTGIGTVLADDPGLTCRLPGLEDRSPRPFIVDSFLRLPESAKLARPGTMVLTTQNTFAAQPEKIARLKDKGVDVLGIFSEGGRPNLVSIMLAIAHAGINRLMVEAGPALVHTVMDSMYADMLYWFRAPVLAPGSKMLFAPPDPSALTCVETRNFGPDVLKVYEIKM